MFLFIFLLEIVSLFFRDEVCLDLHVCAWVTLSPQISFLIPLCGCLSAHLSESSRGWLPPECPLRIYMLHTLTNARSLLSIQTIVTLAEFSALNTA